MTARAKGHYVKRTGDLICEQIALGKTLQQALDKVGYLAPTIARFWRWLEDFPEFRDQYERARQLSADMNADRMQEIGEKVIDPGNVKAAAAYKVYIEVLKWNAEMRNAAKYGKNREVKGREPMDPAKMRKEIARLEKELGVLESKVVPLRKVE